MCDGRRDAKWAEKIRESRTLTVYFDPRIEGDERVTRAHAKITAEHLGVEVRVKALPS